MIQSCLGVQPGEMLRETRLSTIFFFERGHGIRPIAQLWVVGAVAQLVALELNVREP